MSFTLVYYKSQFMKTNGLLGCLLIHFSIFLVACNNQSPYIEETLSRINSQTSASIHFVDRQNERAFYTLLNRLNDPVTSYKASLWEPKMVLIQKHCDQMVNALRTFIVAKNHTGEKLNDSINQFKVNLLGVDSSVRNVFEKDIKFFTEPYDSAHTSSEGFITSKFIAASPIARDAYLNVLIEQVKILENRLLNFCLEHCVSEAFVYDTYSAIFGQSSSKVAPKESIEITAGVGAFSRKAKPVISIAGKTIQLMEDGAAHYNFHAPGKPGKYTIPAKISYTDEYGKIQVIEKNIEYRVVGN